MCNNFSYATCVNLILIKFYSAVKYLINVSKNVTGAKPKDLSQTADFENTIDYAYDALINNTTFTSHNVKVSTYSYILQERTSFKSYLRYKTITSQNVPSEAQVKNFFVL